MPTLTPTQALRTGAQAAGASPETTERTIAILHAAICSTAPKTPEYYTAIDTADRWLGQLWYYASTQSRSAFSAGRPESFRAKHAREAANVLNTTIATLRAWS